MPIVIACDKGHRMKVGEEFAGRKVRCPTCHQVVIVPSPAAVAAKISVVAEAPTEVTIEDLTCPIADAWRDFCQAVADREPSALELEFTQFADVRAGVAK